MDNSILSGKYIRNILISNNECREIVGEKVFPLMLNPPTPDMIKFPFILFTRSLTPVYNKSLLVENQLSFVVIAVSNDYNESLELANAIRHSLETYIIKNNDLHTTPIRLESVNEETVNDAYLQTLIFTCTTR